MLESIVLNWLTVLAEIERPMALQVIPYICLHFRQFRAVGAAQPVGAASLIGSKQLIKNVREPVPCSIIVL
jgi:hypothetical protein